jgi:Fic family protein
MMDDDAVITRLDRIIAVLKLANRDAIEATRNEILSDRVNREILGGTSNWTAAGKLQTAVARKTGASTRTVRDRLADLVSDGLLEKRGGGPTTEYRTTGLI